MTDVLTNAYGKTDAHGKGNLANLIQGNGNATSAELLAFFQANYAMDTTDWNNLFGTNIIYSDTNGDGVLGKTVGSLLKQTTLANDNVELFTTDIVLQVMERLEKAIQNTSFTYTQYEKLRRNFQVYGIKLYHILHLNRFWNTPDKSF